MRPSPITIFISAIDRGLRREDPLLINIRRNKDKERADIRKRPEG
jgi:hypothetical protein